MKKIVNPWESQNPWQQGGAYHNLALDVPTVGEDNDIYLGTRCRTEFRYNLRGEIIYSDMEISGRGLNQFIYYSQGSNLGFNLIDTPLLEVAALVLVEMGVGTPGNMQRVAEIIRNRVIISQKRLNEEKSIEWATTLHDVINQPSNSPQYVTYPDGRRKTYYKMFHGIEDNANLFLQATRGEIAYLRPVGSYRKKRFIDCILGVLNALVLKKNWARHGTQFNSPSAGSSYQASAESNALLETCYLDEQNRNIQIKRYKNNDGKGKEYFDYLNDFFNNSESIDWQNTGRLL